MATEYKLSYTAPEIDTRLGKIDTLATKSEVPTKTSQLANDSDFATNATVNNALSTKANSSHGNHVPATETADNAKFLRNDNTWQKVTPANIGAAAKTHTHDGYAPAYTYGTEDLEAGTSPLETGKLYFVYE